MNSQCFILFGQAASSSRRRFTQQNQPLEKQKYLCHRARKESFETKSLSHCQTLEQGQPTRRNSTVLAFLARKIRLRSHCKYFLLRKATRYLIRKVSMSKAIKSRQAQLQKSSKKFMLCKSRHGNHSSKQKPMGLRTVH